jgi:hypothetical protein
MAAPDGSTTLEGAIGGLPLVRTAGLNTNKAVNFSGFQVSTGGNPSFLAGGALTGSVTGPTGSFNVVNIQQAGIVGSTGSAAVLGTAGALGGGPATAAQTGWTIVYVAGVKSWVPYWR